MKPSYLVICRHSMDDIPLALFPERADAKRFIDTFDIAESNPAYWDTDASTLLSLAIVTFDGPTPVSVEVERLAYHE